MVPIIKDLETCEGFFIQKVEPLLKEGDDLVYEAQQGCLLCIGGLGF